MSKTISRSLARCTGLSTCTGISRCLVTCEAHLFVDILQLSDGNDFRVFPLLMNQDETANDDLLLERQSATAAVRGGYGTAVGRFGGRRCRDRGVFIDAGEHAHDVRDADFFRRNRGRSGGTGSGR